MNQRMLRTLMFVGAAAICVGAAIATSIATRPVKLDDAALVGEEFFPDFQDPTKATGLRVAAYDKDAARVNLFNVEFNDGLWRIPSHHNYPADGEDQLAKTAASVVGIERGVYAGKTPEDQKRMGVLDPLDDSITGTEGRGARITLFQAGKALVDLIVGQKVEESGNIYYVRKADDNRVYRAELAGLKVSTKFAEWIEPDLLKLDRNKLVQMVIDRYRIDEQRGSLVQGDISVLTKDAGSTTAQWELEGLDPATEKLKSAAVNNMSFALDDLKIVGVREKPAGLVAALKGEQGSGLNQIEQIQMQRAGYFLTPEGQLVSNEGEILAGTDEGVRYTLRFGEVLSGTDVEIEVGSDAETTADADLAATDSEAAESTSDVDADKPDDGGTDDSAVKKNRYAFITAAFDENLLGDAPAAPLKPVPPVEPPAAEPDGDVDTPAKGDDAATDEPGPDPLDSGDDEQDADDAADAAETAADDQTATDDDAAQPAAEADKTDEPAEKEADASAETKADDTADEPAAADADKPEPAAEPDPQKVYEDALKKYEFDLAMYEAQTAEFNKKIEAGTKLAKELNDRFAPWYYVISAELFAKLKVDRSELVEPATPAADATGATGDNPAGLPFTLPSSPEANAPADDNDAKPAAESATDTTKEEGGDAGGAQDAKPAESGEEPAASESSETSDTADPAPSDANDSGDAGDGDAAKDE